MEFTASWLITSLVVSSLGFVLFSYGRKLSRPPQLVSGLVMLVFPYFVSSVVWMLVITVLLIGALWLALWLGH